MSSGSVSFNPNTVEVDIWRARFPIIPCFRTASVSESDLEHPGERRGIPGSDSLTLAVQRAAAIVSSEPHLWTDAAKLNGMRIFSQRTPTRAPAEA